MRGAIVIANGEMDIPPGIRAKIQASTYIIAADGGVNNCHRLKIQPHAIIGDLDSMQPGDVEAYREAGIKVIQYPAHKDETDLELALRYVMNKEVDEVTILGGLGARWDMTIANILLIVHPLFDHLKICYLDGTQEVALLRAGERSVIDGAPGDTISLIPLAGDASGITTQGLEYPLRDGTLQFGATRGVSNVFTGGQAEIYYREGRLLCVVNRQKQKLTKKVRLHE